MMTITKTQITELERIRLNFFHQLCINDIRVNYSQWIDTMSVDEINSLVYKQDKRAVYDFQIKEEKYRYKFIILSIKYPILVGNKFTTQIAEILYWPDRRSDKKIGLLQKYFSKENKNEIE